MTSVTAVSDRLLAFVAQKFPLARKRRLGVDDPLLESGIVDSLGVLDVVKFIEAEFGIQVADEELVPDNFQTLGRVSRLVMSKLPAAAGQNHDDHGTASGR
jgi:acyl carrier protein